MYGQTTLTFTLKKKGWFKKPFTITRCAEDEYWAIKNLEREFPKHKLLSRKVI